MKFLIIEPFGINGKKSGRGARGKNLKVFLDTYYGKNSTSLISYKKFHSSNTFSVDHLFIGIPSAITAKDLNRINYKKIHLFDYGDNHCIDWGDSDSELFLSCYDTYLKPWVQDNWSDAIRWGTLPIRRNRSLALSLMITRFKGSEIYENSNGRKYDLSFLGNPVVGWSEKPGSEPKYIRVNWLEEISLQNKFSFKGGFFMRGESAHRLRDEASDSMKHYFLNKGRMNFFSYFNLMINSKSTLAPPGNALWSYRHYESIYAGTMPISADFRHARMLIPLPLDGMIHIRNGDSVVRGVEKAVKKLTDCPFIIKENLNFIEKYLTNGLYDKKKKQLLERFMSQINRY